MASKTLHELQGEILAKPGVRAAYAELAPEYELARAVIQARIAAGLTQAQLAERMNTTQPQIARIESGRSLPSMRTLFRIAQATGTRPQVSFKPVAPKRTRRGSAPVPAEA